MFKTIFSVTKEVSGSREFVALFEDYVKAKAFFTSLVEEVSKEENEDFQYWRANHLDGSFFETWFSERYDFNLDDNAWITDEDHSDKILFYDNTGIVFKFDSMEAVREYFKRSQEIALN